MSVVSLLNVDVKNNPAAFDAPYEFEITFECLEPLQKGGSRLQSCYNGCANSNVRLGMEGYIRRLGALVCFRVSAIHSLSEKIVLAPSTIKYWTASSSVRSPLA